MRNNVNNHSSDNRRRGRRRRNTRKSTNFLPLIIVVGIILAIVIFIISLISSHYAKLSSIEMNGSLNGESVQIEIPSGSTVTDIAKLLEKNDVIDSAKHFKYLCKKHSQGSSFKSGMYTFTAYETFDSLVEKINSGAPSSDTIIVTIREGLWLTEIAELMEENGICTKEEFMAAANSKDYNYDFINDIPKRENLLEGYLYPETYYFSKTSTAGDVVNKMLEQFDKVCTELKIKEDAKAMGLTLDEAIIISSLIEAEVKYEPERALVSSVIHNRIKENMKLQIDASVIYSMGKRVTRVYYSDLENTDPHNTYHVYGLPSGPICAPRGASLKAAVNPDSTNYLYYVVENPETGQHSFAATYEEFKKAKENYQNIMNNWE